MFLLLTFLGPINKSIKSPPPTYLGFTNQDFYSAG